MNDPDRKPGDPRPYMFKRTLGTFGRFHRRGPYAVSRRFKVEFDELADPNHDSRVGFRDLEIYAYLVRTAPPRTERQRGPLSMLSGGSAYDGYEVYPIGGTDPSGRSAGRDWRTELARRCRHAMFNRHVPQSVKEWRRRIGLVPGGTVVVTGPTVNPFNKAERNPSHAEMTNRVHGLFWESDGDMAWSLNPVHPGAVRLQQLKLKFAGDGRVTAEVDYGLPDYPYSHWTQTLAVQQKGEPLLVTVDRAWAELQRLKDPAADPPPMISYGTDTRAKPAPGAGIDKTEVPEKEPPLLVKQSTDLFGDTA